MYQKKFKIQEIVEGEEDDAFWDALGDDEDYVSYLGGIHNFEIRNFGIYILFCGEGDSQRSQLPTTFYLKLLADTLSCQTY